MGSFAVTCDVHNVLTTLLSKKARLVYSWHLLSCRLRCRLDRWGLIHSE